MNARPLAGMAAVLAIAISDSAHAQESLIYEVSTGNYILTYDCGDEGGIVTTTLVPSNKVIPAMESAFSSDPDGVKYVYSVSLAQGSRDALRMFAMEGVESVAGIVEPPSQAMLTDASPEELKKHAQDAIASAPSGWTTIHYTNYDGTTRVGWSRREMGSSEFGPGSRQGGFGFNSPHLPGIVRADFEGDGDLWRFPCESPGPDTQVGRDLDVVRRNDRVPRFAAAPIIKVAEPLNVVSILKNLRAHLGQIQQWTLIDGAFATQFSGYLSEAISKLEKDDEVAAANPLISARIALRNRYPLMGTERALHAVPPSPVPLNPVDEIRKLVTDYDRVLVGRVLDFDLDYVMGRLGFATGTYIVDETDVASVSSTGAWVRLVCDSEPGGIETGCNGATYQEFYKEVGAVKGTFTWKPKLPNSGRYRVYSRSPVNPNFSPNVEFEVTTASGAAIARRSQRTGEGWQLLGTYDLDRASAQVTLKSATDGPVVADAVWFVPEAVSP